MKQEIKRSLVKKNEEKHVLSRGWAIGFNRCERKRQTQNSRTPPDNYPIN